MALQCADVEITVIKKGEIFDVPCHYKHHDKVGARPGGLSFSPLNLLPAWLA